MITYTQTELVELAALVDALPLGDDELNECVIAIAPAAAQSAPAAATSAPLARTFAPSPTHSPVAGNRTAPRSHRFWPARPVRALTMQP
jgi:hypothetical protein